MAATTRRAGPTLSPAAAWAWASSSACVWGADGAAAGGGAGFEDEGGLIFGGAFTGTAATGGFAGAAVVVPDDELTGERLAGDVSELLADRARLALMAQRARTLARPDAAERVAESVLALARRGAASATGGRTLH